MSDNRTTIEVDCGLIDTNPSDVPGRIRVKLEAVSVEEILDQLSASDIAAYYEANIY